jgi:hypothetical protein
LRNPRVAGFTLDQLLALLSGARPSTIHTLKMTDSLKELANYFEVRPDPAIDQNSEGKDEAKNKKKSQELLCTELRQIILAAAGIRIAGAAPGGRVRRPPINTARGQVATVYRLSQNASDFL